MNYLPNILNQLNIIYNCKNNISNALENQGQNMNNVTFENYYTKLDNLYSNLNYISFVNSNSTNLDRDLSIFNFSLFTTMSDMFYNCTNLINIPELNTTNVTNITNMFYKCNNLSNNSIQNIINMCINSNITNSILMNLSNENIYSPLYGTKFDNSYYQNRLTDLTNTNWTY